MTRFINRVSELEHLESEYASDSSTFTVIYGRRRVGKTALISEFLKDKDNAIYFLAAEGSEYINKDIYKKQVSKFIDNPHLATADVEWFDIFESLAKFKTDTKKIIVIDEFQYLGMANPAFPSLFNRAWELVLAKSDVMVIICGSLINMMMSQALSYSSPLYGRRTGQIKMKQVDWRFYKEFFPNLSFEDMVLYYSVTGGVPKYIETFKDSKNVYDAIENKVLNKDSYLYEEPYFLLSKEVSDVGSYFPIIRAIAFGNRKISDIASALGKKVTDLTTYLKVLIDLDLIEREVPATEDYPERSKKGLYRLKDYYFSFWFRFVYTNFARLEKGEKDYVMEQIKKSFIVNHVAYIYEDVCHEKMWELNNSDTWDFHFNKIGRYWDSNTEIDIVAISVDYSAANAPRKIILGECKFSKNKKGAGILNDLKEREQAVLKEVPNGKIVSYVIFSKGGFTDELIQLAKQDKNIILVCQ